MTKEETVKIMALLGAFYAGGKNDPKIQAQAWHMILYKYDFDIAQHAVLRFAENDTREYATYPAVGRIVSAIKAETASRNKPIDEVIKGVSYGTSYDRLSVDARRLVSSETYEEWLKVDAEEFQKDADKYVEILRGRRNRLLESKRW